MTTTLRDTGEADVLATSARLGEPEWLRDRRLEAFKAFSDLPWPTRRDEVWRYTDPERIDLDRPVLVAPGATPPRTGGIVAAVRDGLDGSALLVDGSVVRATVCAEAAAHGVVVASLADAARDHRDLLEPALGAAVGVDDKFDALNFAAATGGVFVHVPREVELTRPIAVEILAGTDGASLPRVVVSLGPNARARVYVDHAGDAAQTVVEVVEAVLAEGARLDLVTAQDWGDHVDHVGSHTGAVGASADHHHLEVTFGGATVYLRPDVHLNGRGGNAEMLGVYFTDEGQHVEHRSLIHHNASQTTSDTVYKGAVQGRSSATWFGNIRIEAHAKATASDETNRNLILSDGAKADTIPFLEILCSDVAKCGHHSSVGQVDELQLFYLESRGIPRDEAAKLLVFGFFKEVTDRIGLPGVTETVLAEIEHEVLTGPTTLMHQRRS